MIGILIFCVIMALLTVGFRYVGSWYYDKIYGKSTPEIQNEVVEQFYEDSTLVEENDEELVAVITAAAIETLKKPVVVTKIKSVASNSQSAWSLAGRQNVMGGHSVTINR